MPHYNEEYWKKLNISMNEWSELVICYESTVRRYQFGDNSTVANHLGKLGLVAQTSDDGDGSRYGWMTITAIGRLIVDMSDSFSRHADNGTDDLNTITITTADAHNIVIALVGQIKRLNENIDDPDYEGNTDNLVRLVRETEAILDRLTTQLNANGG